MCVVVYIAVDALAAVRARIKQRKATLAISESTSRASSEHKGEESSQVELQVDTEEIHTRSDVSHTEEVRDMEVEVEPVARQRFSSKTILGKRAAVSSSGASTKGRVKYFPKWEIYEDTHLSDDESVPQQLIEGMVLPGDLAKREERKKVTGYPYSTTTDVRQGFVHLAKVWLFP